MISARKKVGKMLPGLWALFFISGALVLPAEGTRLLRQPTANEKHIVFAYAADLWLADLQGGEVTRLTSTPAVESDPHLSPDGRWLAFTSNRSGLNSVYRLALPGGEVQRLTWYPAPARVRGWTPDGNHILYSSSRATAPVPHDRLWLVPASGGPSRLLSRQWGADGSFAPDGKRLVIDRVARWDVEWRAYRGGQNTPLVILDLQDNSETLIPNERSTDIQPVWLGEKVYFLSDRDWTANIWSFCPASAELQQLTFFADTDVKWLGRAGAALTFERDGYLHLFDPETLQSRELPFEVRGDFPWAETAWTEVSDRVRGASLSPTGKRALMEARGEIFTLPLEHGDARNLTASPGAADRAPLWSPQGGEIAWFSDAGHQEYRLFIAAQDGLSPAREFSLGESKMAWEPNWSPDGKNIAFVDDKVRIRVINLETGAILTADVGGNNLERGNNGLAWSADSRWLAYVKTGTNGFRRILAWSRDDRQARFLTNELADSFAPAWDRNGRQLYFLAGTDLALGSGWANTSSMQAGPTYGAYLVNLQADLPSPFSLRSDEEEAVRSQEKKNEKGADKKNDSQDKKSAPTPVNIDFEGLERRILALPMPVRNYQYTLAGPEGTVFISEVLPGQRTAVLHKFSLESRKAEEFLKDARQVTLSADGKTMLFRQGERWATAGTAAPPKNGGKTLKLKLVMKLDRQAEWRQVFHEAWRYQRDYFYDPGLHGRDWQVVYDRYAPLLSHVRHRADLNYLLDMMNGELSVGHSFVFGGDLPKVDDSRVGVLGVDFSADKNYWKIERIFNAESWNPGLAGPLDQPGLNVRTGQYLVGVNGRELTAKDDPYSFFDGRADLQTVIHLNDQPAFAGSRRITVKPLSSEQALRQRAWVEDNRRLVDRLSAGRLAYVWVPNTGGQGMASFNRYFFAQQDREGAVIDERFNGGGLLDDYMVDLMTRSLRAGLTNEALNGRPFRLPAGILGPKVLLINELAGSGGDFFPWIFRRLKVGPLIGARTWGGLVRSAVHYPLVDGGALTAPDNAVFDPLKRQWVAENQGVPPDIEVRLDAVSLAEGRDVQLERAVQEALSLLEKQGSVEVKAPPFSRPAKKD